MESVKNEVKKDEVKTMTFKGIYLGSSWAEGISKDKGKLYAFGKVRLDFEDVKKDGTSFTNSADLMFSDKTQLPGEEIEKYKPVLVEFVVPRTPIGKFEFVRIIKNI